MFEFHHSLKEAGRKSCWTSTEKAYLTKRSLSQRHMCHIPKGQSVKGRLWQHRFQWDVECLAWGHSVWCMGEGEGEGGRVAESRSGRKELERKGMSETKDAPWDPVCTELTQGYWRGDSWRKERVADTLTPHPSPVVFSFAFFLSRM